MGVLAYQVQPNKHDDPLELYQKCGDWLVSAGHEITPQGRAAAIADRIPVQRQIEASNIEAPLACCNKLLHPHDSAVGKGERLCRVRQGLTMIFHRAK